MTWLLRPGSVYEHSSTRNHKQRETGRRTLAGKTNRASSARRSTLRHGIEHVSLFGRQKRRLRIVYWVPTWHCPSLCVLRTGKRFGHRSCDDVCCARIALLGDNQPNPAPNGHGTTATVDRRRHALSFPCANRLVVIFPLSRDPVSGGSTGQRTLSWSRVTEPRAFRSDEDDPDSDSSRPPCRRYSCHTS